MTKQVICFLVFVFITCCPTGLAQAQRQLPTTNPITTQVPLNETEKKNIDAYVELIRSNVRQEKSEIMGAVMQLNSDDSAKFWPIYSEYNAELTKLNNLRKDNILEYARTYNDMTDSKADELVKRAADYQRQRLDLLGRYYERVKEAIGATNAARFLQIENQLLLIIDLQLTSDLPIVGQS